MPPATRKGSRLAAFGEHRTADRGHHRRLSVHHQSDWPVADDEECARRFAGFALLWPVSLDARQQFFFQRSPAFPEPLNLRLETVQSLCSTRYKARRSLHLSLPAGARSLHPQGTLPIMIGCARSLSWL